LTTVFSKDKVAVIQLLTSKRDGPVVRSQEVPNKKWIVEAHGLFDLGHCAGTYGQGTKRTVCKTARS